MDVELSRWRGEESPLPGGGLLINDAYNANPASMRAALEHLAEHEGRKVAVLGEMAELGPTAPAYHREVGDLVQSLGIDVGARGRRRSRASTAESSRRDAGEAVREGRRSSSSPGDVVLVKGSRAVGLEIVAEALTGVPA